MPPEAMQINLWQRILIWAAILAVLLAVFALYLQPQFMLTLADQVWACF
ncbi:hypothetical protein CLU84_3023 [Comamonas sp. 26]|nr:hypothetical protein CLU84_3023 [Comamonas sp. 26]